MTKIEENKGLLKTWKDDRGFGFIKPEDGSDDIFIHISALTGSERRPHRGDTIYYAVEESGDGKFKAINAHIEGVQKNSEDSCGSNKWLWWTGALLVVASIGVMIFVWENNLI